MPRVSKPSASAPVAEQTARRRPRSVDSGRGDGPSARSVGQKRPRSSCIFRWWTAGWETPWS